MRKRMNPLVISPILLLTLPFCAARMQAQAAMQGAADAMSASQRGTNSQLGTVPADFAKLRIAPGFQLSLHVLEDSDFDGDYRVDQDGNIVIPGLGQVHVADKTASQVTEELRQRFISGEILKDPRINLLVSQYTAPEVAILGEVQKPGKYPLLAPRDLVDVLALAGGETITAGGVVSVTHDSGKTESIRYSADSNSSIGNETMIRPGDTVQVNRAGIVYVMGAVNRPGGYVMREGGTLNLLEVISLASGTTPVARTKTVFIARKQGDGATEYIELPYKKIVEGKSADVRLRPSDIVYVPSSKIKSFLAGTTGIAESAATAAVYKY